MTMKYFSLLIWILTIYLASSVICVSKNLTISGLVTLDPSLATSFLTGSAFVAYLIDKSNPDNIIASIELLKIANYSSDSPFHYSIVCERPQGTPSTVYSIQAVFHIGYIPDTTNYATPVNGDYYTEEGGDFQLVNTVDFYHVSLTMSVYSDTAWLKKIPIALIIVLGVLTILICGVILLLFVRHSRRKAEEQRAEKEAQKQKKNPQESFKNRSFKNGPHSSFKNWKQKEDERKQLMENQQQEEEEEA